MVAGYNLRVKENIGEFKDYIEKGECHLEPQKSIACDCLNKYITNGIADGTKIEKDWFPNVCKEQYFEHSEDRNDGYSAAYRVTLNHLKNISVDDLHNWKALYDKEEIQYPIDYLYKLTHKKEAACILTNTLYS